MMNCEEFELRGLDLDRTDADPEEALSAARHAEVCGTCRSLLESWRGAKSDLALLREATRVGGAPARVEMRLKQEVRTKREARVPRSGVAVAGWLLAAAAVLAISVGWVRTQQATGNSGIVGKSKAVLTPQEAAVAEGEGAATREDGTLLAADYDTGEFTELPGSLAGASDDGAIVQVRLQRGTLARLGLPVEQDRSSDWVDVDFLVGEDGQPQAVRLHQDYDSAAATPQ